MTEEKKGKGEIRLAIPDDLRQRDVERYFKALRKLQGGEINLSGPERNGAVVRAAVRCGWVVGIGEEAKLKASRLKTKLGIVVKELANENPDYNEVSKVLQDVISEIGGLEGVSDLKPWVVTEWAARVSDAVTEAFVVPGE